MVEPYVREATVADAAAILGLIRELAEYEREPLENIRTTEADLRRDGFGPHPTFKAFLAFDGDGDGGPVGFALYFYTWSTWEGRRCIHLEDLFVRPTSRKKGLGLRLMRAVARTAIENGCARMTWQVLDWNKPAFDFYARVGGKVLNDWISVRLEGDALRSLAEIEA